MIEVKNLDGLIESFLRFPTESRRAIVVSLDEIGKAVTRKAKAEHRFRRKTGALQRSIRYETQGRGADALRLRIYLDSRITTTKTKSGQEYSYGLIQHDGTGKGYDRSWASPAFSPKLKTAGLEADHFLTDAYDALVEENRRTVVEALDRVSEKLF